MATALEYLKANDNASDYAEDQITKLNQTALEEIDLLMNEAGERDDELWQAWDVDTDLVVEDYNDEADRNIDWMLGLAGLSAASAGQFFLDHRDETLIKPLAYRAQVVGSLVITKDALKEAGRRAVTMDIAGPPKFVALQAKYVNEFAGWRGFSNLDLYEALSEIGAMRPIDKLIADQAGYVARMTSYPPNSPQFTEEVVKLIDVNSDGVLRNMNRRAIERVNTVRQIGGDMQALLVWICEGGNPCDRCAANGGEVHTYEDWLSIGLPGAETCKGADRCHCIMERV